VTSPYWPVLDIRLRSSDLELRPMTEADQPAIVALLPDDVELDPAATTYPGQDPMTARGTVVHQTYWKYYGSWSPEAWRLNFVVLSQGELVGVQELEGNDFARLRTLDTSSFLMPSARGLGIGKAMRRAVLALGFGPLDAQAAVTEAWHDNSASLGVSRALGYRPNGEALHRRGDGVDTMVHLRLTRTDWLASGLGAAVELVGVEPALPFFGLYEPARRRARPLS
jgi:RimJ/RimL family protein N-acetyltransferase